MKQILFQNLFQILFLLPFFIIGIRKNKVKSFTNIIYFVLIYILVDLILTKFSSYAFFEHQQWNWVGKGVALLIEILFILIIPRFSKTDFYITTKIDWTNSRTLLTFCLIYFVVRVILYIISGEATTILNFETFLYQASLPGLQEEILYRGILLGLLSIVFTLPRFNFLKVNFGLATIITSILFGLVHALTIYDNYSLNINYFTFVRTTFDGLLFALLVKKTKSIVPSIIFHNLLNLIGSH